MKDLIELAGGPALTPAERRSMIRKGPKPNGYAGTPGGGPVGETCRSCRHIVRREFAKTYLKCGLAAHTGGRGTDILARSPACALWEAKT